jgi:hypothetical protein
VFEVPGAELARRPEASFNLHDFRWENALYAGRRIFGTGFPDDVTVYLIEAESTGFGLALGRAVDHAAGMVERMLRARIREAAGVLV